MHDELAIQRMKRMSEELEEREQALLRQAALRKLYRAANGRDPETSDVLAVWAQANLRDTDVDPYEVLTKNEIAQVWEDAEGVSRGLY